MANRPLMSDLWLTRLVCSVDNRETDAARLFANFSSENFIKSGILTAVTLAKVGNGEGIPKEQSQEAITKRELGCEPGLHS